MIRKFSISDREQIIDLFIKNTPEFFDPSEETELKNYLDSEIEDYFVYEENFKIVGAGGINYFSKSKFARLSWDLIDPEWQGKGIGSKLGKYRIRYIAKNSNVEMVYVRTSQFVFKFYEKLGFQLIKVKKDFWAKGYDLYEMEKKLIC